MSYGKVFDLAVQVAHVYPGWVRVIEKNGGSPIERLELFYSYMPSTIKGCRRWINTAKQQEV